MDTRLTTERNKLRTTLREQFPREHGQLLPSLHFLQHEFGYLPDWAMEVVGWHLGIPASEVYGAATSYTEFRINQPDGHVVRICTGLSCWINGGAELLDLVKAAMYEGDVVVEETACGFLCAMAPAIEVDGSWVGRATTELVSGKLQEASPT